MIPAKDKAIETFHKYNTIVSNEFTSDTLKSATIALKCAIAEIEAIINTNSDPSIYGTAFNDYYKEVKQELGKL
jgi:hypothetical protein